MQVMENRIRRLEYEDQRAHKMEAAAHDRASRMMEARQRHFEESMIKKHHFMNVQREESRQRMINQMTREQSKHSIHNARLDALSTNYQSKEDVK